MSLSFPDFEEFRHYDQEILREIIRDGESEMKARLETANAADRRALTLVGFQLTIAVAMTSAAYSLVAQGQPDIELAILAIGVVAGMIAAAFSGLQSVSPSLFCFPGNDPKNWHYEQWNYKLDSWKSATLRHALAEQCFTLHTGLRDNKAAMELAAQRTKFSLYVMFGTIYLCGFVSCFVIATRLF